MRSLAGIEFYTLVIDESNRITCNYTNPFVWGAFTQEEGTSKCFTAMEKVDWDSELQQMAASLPVTLGVSLYGSDRA
jgi:hypothetical protein